jgi:hypothetical protein
MGEKGRILAYCHAGCSTADVVKAVGLTMAELMGEASEHLTIPRPVLTMAYTLVGPRGEQVAKHHRTYYDDGSKTVWWTRSGSNGLSGLPHCRPAPIRASWPLSGSCRCDRGLDGR